MPRFVHARETLELPPRGLRLIAVADTHGHAHPNTSDLVARLAPDHIVHAGDVGDLAVLEGLRAIAPLSVVRGNIDTATAALPDAITLTLGADGRALFTILLLHIALYGPKLRADAGRLARGEGASLVICGHSHVPFLGRDRELTIFNPGSIGPRRLHLPIVLGVVEIGRERVLLRHVSCETGETWVP